MFASLGFFIVLALSGCSLGPQMPPVPAGFKPQSSERDGIRFLSAGLSQPAPIVLFIHGTPGDSTGFLWYLADPQLQQQFQLIAVDRPGFGQSVTPMTTRLREQAAMIWRALPQDSPILVVGHSLGGPIGLWLAIDHPERVQGVLLVAASLAPEYEQARWFNHLARFWPVRALLPRDWLQANAEVLALPAELELLLGSVAAIKAPIRLIQGEADGLVDPRSPQALSSRLPERQVRLDLVPQAGHFLLWEQPERVRNALQGLHWTPAGQSH